MTGRASESACRGWESNPDGDFSPEDFKSPDSTSGPRPTLSHLSQPVRTPPQNVYTKAHKPHPRNRESYNAYMREYMARRYHERRERLVKRMGGECQECGATEALQIDHRERAEKAFDVAKRLASAPWKEILAEVRKCHLLCEPCHALKTQAHDLGRTVKSPRLLRHHDDLSGAPQLSLFVTARGSS